MSKVVRYGILVDGPVIKRWQADVIRGLECEGAILSLVIVNADGLAKTKSKSAIFSGLLEVYNRCAQPWTEQPVDLIQVCKGVPQIVCTPIRIGKWGQGLAPPDLDTIRDSNLDFLMRFGFNILKGEVLTAARLGVWSFHHGDEMAYRGRPAGFWEVYEGNPITGVVLQRLTERLDGGIVLRKGWFPTQLSSYRRNREVCYGGSSEWPALVARDIARGETGLLDGPLSKTDAPVYRMPTLFQAFKCLGRQFVRGIRNAVGRGLFAWKWNVGIVQAPIDRFLAADPAANVIWLPKPPLGKFRADPFCCEIDATTWILYEEAAKPGGQGRIMVAEWPMGEEGLRATPVAGFPPGHSSYPFTFRFDDRIYCIAETAQARRLELRELIGSPPSVGPGSLILDDVSALDPTIFQHGDYWWLAYTDRDKGPLTHLSLLYAKNPFGPWEPHARNPVKVDVRSARPAGTPFTHNGQFFRPAQDCSHGYGARIVINEVLTLTPTDFEERIVTTVDPFSQDYGRGIHTMAQMGSSTLIDGRTVQVRAVGILMAWWRRRGS